MSVFSWFTKLFQPRMAPVNNIVRATPTLIQDVIAEINTARTLKGLNPLRPDDDASFMAQQWADRMAQNNTLTHGDFSNRVWAQYPNTADSEDIEMNSYQHASDVVDQWLASPPHRANIYGDYTIMGVGCATGTNGFNYWVADFIKA